MDRWAKDLPFFPDHYFPPPTFDNLLENINVQEVWPVVMALAKWGRALNNCTILIWSDNTQVHRMLATGRSKNVIAMSLLRELFWMCFVFNIRIVCYYLRSKENVVADFISRLSYPGVAQIDPPFSLCCYRPTPARRGTGAPPGHGVGIRHKAHTEVAVETLL